MHFLRKDFSKNVLPRSFFEVTEGGEWPPGDVGPRYVDNETPEECYGEMGELACPEIRTTGAKLSSKRKMMISLVILFWM